MEREEAQLKAMVAQKALAEGFATCRVCEPGAVDIGEKLGAFLEAGYHGTMGWMEERKGWRAEPEKLWPEARSVIVLGEVYTPAHDPMEVLEHPGKGAISVYAQNRDYHDVVKKRLKRLARWLVDQTGEQVKVFVDTAPVPEKAIGQESGLGWQGKHTNLVSREMGSWFFIGSVFTTARLEPDEAEVDHCGSCRACLDVCPTDAFPGPYRLDARRCISYLTIEHAGPVDEDLRPLMGNRIYGCDDCLAVCPWNKFAQEAKEAKYHARADLVAPDLAELARLDDAGFRQMFSGSPIKRIKRGRFVRNVLYAIGNSGDAGLREVARGLCGDEDPVVADAARWAVSQTDGTARES